MYLSTVVLRLVLEWDEKVEKYAALSVLREAFSMNIGGALLSEEDRKLIGATKKLMDELIETLDVMSSPEELEAVRESLREVREGRVTSWDDYKRDLKAKGKL